MKSRLLVIAALAVVLSIALGGCFGNTWKVSFALPNNYSDWAQQDLLGSIESVPAFGVRLNKWALSSPVAFDEDFTITVNFSLITDADETALFGICVGDEKGFFPSNYIYSRFNNIGLEDFEDWWIEDDGASAVRPVDVIDSTLPTLLRKGPNIWRLVKTGNNIKVYVNLYKVADFPMANCAAAKYYINLYSDLTGGGDVIFTSIKVDYKGSMEL